MCVRSVEYFIERYCQIYDATSKNWMAFDLWPEQREALRQVLDNRLVVVLKARQLGLTWLLLAVVLWMALFQPGATILLFSKRDDEAVYLLSQERLRGIFRRLPAFLRVGIAPVSSNDHEWVLNNGSVIRAFPSNAGDSYTASFVLIDEADLVADLNRLMASVKPTIDAGGRMVLLSRSDKTRPQSPFKQIYRGARAGENGWQAIFMAWNARPDRTAGWYEAVRRDVLSRTASLDELWEQYPASDTEALAARSLDKRLPPEWLRGCLREMTPGENVIGLPGLEMYRPPMPGRAYVIGADPAEGNPTSDDSALEVLELESGEQVASLAGKFEPATFGSYIDQVAMLYNYASVMVERNNHGHAVLLWLTDNSNIACLSGLDGRRGWTQNSRSKAQLYASVAEALRGKRVLLHGFGTYTQLATIEGSSLSAPAGEHDDRAMAFGLAVCALERPGVMVFDNLFYD
jgi:hypothetical protein